MSTTIGEPANFEEQALKFVGRDLYEAFFRGYTIKQWGCAPTELPAEVLKRLPVRFDYNDNYYDSPWQALPRQGYTDVVDRMLDPATAGAFERRMAAFVARLLPAAALDTLSAAALRMKV